MVKGSDVLVDLCVIPISHPTGTAWFVIDFPRSLRQRVPVARRATVSEQVSKKAILRVHAIEGAPVMELHSRRVLASAALLKKRFYGVHLVYRRKWKVVHRLENIC